MSASPNNAGSAVNVTSVLPRPSLRQGAKRILEQRGHQKALSFEEASVRLFREAWTTSLLRIWIHPEEDALMGELACSQQTSVTNVDALRRRHPFPSQFQFPKE